MASLLWMQPKKRVRLNKKSLSNRSKNTKENLKWNQLRDKTLKTMMRVVDLNQKLLLSQLVVPQSRNSYKQKM